MKKIVFGISLMALAVSCGENRHRSDSSVEKQSETADSLSSSSAVDKEEEEGWVIEEVIPETADESFADFFYNFASDADFQQKRVQFPLAHYTDKQVVRIPADEWKFDPLFSQEQAYTVLFDKEEDMEMEKDTALTSVQIDQMDLEKRVLKRHYFERKEQKWYLEAINEEKMPPATHTQKEDFLTFYQRFSCDSLFQQARLSEPLAFVTVDPEDEFQILETTLGKGQWSGFRPPMMKGRLTNVHYGQPEVADFDEKIVEFKGFGNGFNNVLYFQRKGGIWKLVKFEDLGD